MSIAKRITYLKGLAEGLGLGRDTKEEKILHVIIGILDDITVELTELKEEVAAIDDDLGTLSGDVEDLEDFLEESEEEEACGRKSVCYVAPAGTQPIIHQPVVQPLKPKSEPPAPVPPAPPEPPPAKPMFYAVSCPECQNEITIDEDVLALGAIDCPNCGEKLEFDLEDDE